MNTNKVLQQLIKIANNQQKVINKLAQQLPNSEVTTFTPGKSWSPTDPVVQHLQPSMMTKRPAQLVLDALDPRVLALLVGSKVEVHDKAVTAFIKPGLKDKTLDAVQKHVSNTVSRVLPVGQYTVSVRETA